MIRKKDLAESISSINKTINSLTEQICNLKEDMTDVLQTLDMSGNNRKTTMGILRYVTTHQCGNLLDRILHELGYRRAEEGEIVADTIVKLGKGKKHGK